MAVDTDGLIERHPEFADTDPVLIESTLAQALRQLNATIYGDKLDDAHALLTAAMLTENPAAECVRMEGCEGRFRKSYEDIRCQVSFGRFRVI